MRFLLLLLFTSLGAYAQTPAPTLDMLRTDFDVKMSELELPLAEWHQKYLAQLQALQTQVQQAGDLDQLLLIKQEMAGDHPTIDPKYTTLARLRSVYEQRNASIEQSIATKRRTLMTEYHRILTAMQSSLTKANRIDEAIKVRDELADLEMRAKANAAVAGRRPGTSGMRTPGANTRPGRLFIFGTDKNGEPMQLPESAKGELFVRVFANHESYFAIDPKGGVLAPPGIKRELELPDEKLKPVSKMSVGQYVAIMLHDDGSLSKTKSQWNDGLIPEGEDFVKIACGNTTNAALKRNGEVVAFGYSLKKKLFVKPEWLRGVADVEVSGDIFIFNMRDGSVQATHFSEEHPWSNKPKGLDGKVVAMAAGTRTSCLFLTDEGKVIGWQAGDIPEDLDSARQIRAGHGVFAAQRPDGSWVTWDTGGKTAADFNKALKKLGPLKDLALGRSFFVAIK